METARVMSGVLDNPGLYHQLTQLSGGSRSDTLPSLKGPPSENAWPESELPALKQLDLVQIKTIIEVNLPLFANELATSPILKYQQARGLFYVSELSLCTYLVNC
jgi:hypothetical protein